MIRSTPVACSRARIFRPSRPMMRPFISSLGMATTETDVPAFRTLDLGTCVAYLLFQVHADAVGFLFGLEDHLLHLGLGIRQQLFPFRGGDEIALAADAAEPDVGDEGTQRRTHHDPYDQE